MSTIPLKQDFDFETGLCGLQILPKYKGKITVVLTEIIDNTGASIRNIFEKVATQVYHQFLSELSIDDIIWIEEYNKEQEVEGNQAICSQVTLSWDPRKQQFHNPQRWPHQT